MDGDGQVAKNRGFAVKSEAITIETLRLICRADDSLQRQIPYSTVEVSNDCLTLLGKHTPSVNHVKVTRLC